MKEGATDHRLLSINVFFLTIYKKSENFGLECKWNTLTGFRTCTVRKVPRVNIMELLRRQSLFCKWVFVFLSGVLAIKPQVLTSSYFLGVTYSSSTAKNIPFGVYEN